MELEVILAVVLGLLLAVLFRRWTKGKTDPSAGDGGSFDPATLFGPGQDPDGFGGKTDRYTWTQTDEEVEVYVPVDAETTKKQVACQFRSGSLRLSVGDQVLIDGNTCKTIDPEECTWQLERGSDETKVWITLVKKEPTSKNQHWQCVVLGDAEIDPLKFGPRVMTVDANNPDSIAAAVRSAR